MSLLTVHLHQVKLHAYHGLYAEEKVLGNDFLVDLSVSFHPATAITQMQQSINYATVYELLKKHMLQATPLLETVAYRLCEAILAQFSLAETVTIAIRKVHPPIATMRGAVGIELTLNRKDLKL